MFYAIQPISDLITFLQECFQFEAYLVYVGPKYPNPHNLHALAVCQLYTCVRTHSPGLVSLH
jgi:hypothetical protein